MSAAHDCVMVGWSARSKCTCIASTESRMICSATCSPPGHLLLFRLTRTPLQADDLPPSFACHARKS
eukprot:6476431-Amphidinium_carterae.3